MSRELRELIANALASEKAYNLPAVGERFGLSPGEGAEAFASKRTYALKRLVALDVEALPCLAERVLAEYYSYPLDEYLQKLREESETLLSPLTRQRVIEYLSGLHLPGKLGITEFLGPLWPLDELPSEDLRCHSFRDEIHYHMVHNDDWDTRHLLLRLGVDRCSERRLLRMLDRTAHPLCREGHEQDSHVAALNELIRPDRLELRAVSDMSGQAVYETLRVQDGVAGRAKNIIFAANGPKPEIVLPDAINNDVQIIKHAEYCLVYDRALDRGLRWTSLVEWWAEREGLSPADIDTERSLYQRLKVSLQSDVERCLFDAYFKLLRTTLGPNLPALVPQVYLHYDPYTVSKFGAARLARQRMDFLILFSGFERVVIEVDGKHHYAEDNTASPRLYAAMVAADRALRLSGYEIYRFGAYELAAPEGDRLELLRGFFEDLMLKHSASLNAPCVRPGFLRAEGHS